ncbi:type I methionyl aminopeptidase [Candidatus Microgenomates bacterium]|jgi:methionyl aminopeptidase|nr:MAG: type I methionyl aminopeptidase [Candidatus Microgenomates bacterium]
MPKISIKTPEEIFAMAEGGKQLAGILSEVEKKVKPGISTLEIDSWIEKDILSFGAKPSFKMVPGYHWASCVGINDEVVHSIPRKDKILKNGDLLKIDLGMFYKGFHTDLSWTRIVGSDLKQKSGFLKAGEKALKEAINEARPGKRIGDISKKIEEVVKKAGFKPVKVLTGHGIGKKLHEEPLIPGITKEKIENTPEILPGMAFAIEVIYNEDDDEVVLGEDNWTIFTNDGKMSGLFEKTIAITENKPLILTPFQFERGH